MEKCRGVLLQCSASFKKCYLLTRGGRNLEPNEMNIHEVLWRLTCSYLPPATKLGQGNIFRSVRQEFCPRGGLPHCMLGYTPLPRTRGRHPPPGPGTPSQDQRQAPPPTSAVHAGRYGQQAAGTHSAGMQSCYK